MIAILTFYNNSINFVLPLESRDKIEDQIFIKRFGHQYAPSSVIYFRSIKDIENSFFCFLIYITTLLLTLKHVSDIQNALITTSNFLWFEF